MNFRRCLVGCWLFLALIVSGLAAQKPATHTAPLAPSESIPNLGPALARVNALKAELREYYACTCKCGCYQKDLDLEADRAIALLRKAAGRHRSGEKPALVLDIDETALSNWAEMDRANFEYNGKDFNAWIESAQAPAIPGTLRLYNEAQRFGVRVFFLTGRSESQRAATEANLRLRGYDRWEKLIMRSPAEKGTTALVYKSAQRAKMVAAGYRLVMNVGDQWSDLKGAPQAEYSVKYPDPFYFIK